MSSRTISKVSHDAPDCMARRSIYYLKQRFTNWPTKAIARELDEPAPTVESWWKGAASPSVPKIGKLFRRYPEMVLFVMEPYLAPDWQKMQAKLREAKKLLEDLEGLKP